MKRKRRIVGIVALTGAFVVIGISVWTVGHSFLRERATSDLAVAVYKDNTDDALAALRAGADPNTRLRLTDKPLTLTQRLAQLWQQLRGAPVPTPAEPEHCPPVIAVAAMEFNTTIVEALLTKGAKPDKFARYAEGDGYDGNDLTYGRTALMWAATYGDARLTKALLAKGANPNFEGVVRGEAPLLLTHEPAVMEILLEAGANIHTQIKHEWNHATPLINMLVNDDNHASQNHQKLYQCLEVLLAHGADINERSEYGGEDTVTPLRVAAVYGTPAELGFLLVHGADPNVFGPYDETPLESATAVGNIDNIKTLLAHGVDPNQRDKNGRTPLFYANENNRSAIQFLLRAGAQVNVKDTQGKTPLQVVEETNNDTELDEVEEFLRAAGAKDY